MSRHHHSRPPAYYAERDPLLQQSAATPRSPPFDALPSYSAANRTANHASRGFARNATAGGRSTVWSAVRGARECASLNLLFVAVFGALAGVSVWLTVKSSRPDGVSLIDWYFAGLMALAEWALEITWVVAVWPRKVWGTGCREAYPKSTSVVGWLAWVKIVLLVFNLIFAYLVQAKLPFSWGLAWISGFVTVDFVLAVVLGLFFH